METWELLASPIFPFKIGLHGFGILSFLCTIFGVLSYIKSSNDESDSVPVQTKNELLLSDI